MTRVVGVDPGTRRTGVAVVERQGTRLVHLYHDVIAPADGADLAGRLHRIHGALVDVIARWKADAVAVEDVFYAQNARSALLLGHVRGVALLAAAQAGIPVRSYAPARVKKVIATSGRAEKSQVERMVGAILGLREKVAPDAADALAVAICDLHAIDWPG